MHGDLFSRWRHASPLDVYVFVVVDERGEHIMSDDICRRCNGKQQGMRRGGRNVQLPDSFMVLRPSSRHSCTYTYVLYVRPNIFRGKKSKKPPSEVRSSDGHVLVCKIWGYISWTETAWTLSFGAENMYICVKRFTDMPGVPAVASFRKKWKITPGTYVFRTETRGDFFLAFWWPAVGGDTFSPLAQILGHV